MYDTFKIYDIFLFFNNNKNDVGNCFLYNKMWTIISYTIQIFVFSIVCSWLFYFPLIC